MKKYIALALFMLLLIMTGVTMRSLLALTHSLHTAPRTDRRLQPPEAAVLRAAVALMRTRGLSSDAALAARLLQQGLWRAATPLDPYLKGAEQAGDTPYAYTLSSGKKPTAIVLAPRFFSQATATGQAALMIHEMGHYRAYVRTGRSDEFDGYKTEYDTHARLGLTEQDGLVYFSLLDGVAEYVVPCLPVYKTKPDVRAYLAQSSGG